MNKTIKFGWDYYNYSQEPEIKKVIQKDFSGFSPDGTYPNDSDTLPLFDSNYQPTNAWHNIVNILSRHLSIRYDLTHKDTTDFIKDGESFVYLIATNGGPRLWCGGENERGTLFHNIKEHTKQHIRDGKVLVTIDMSFEGFPMDGSDWLSRIDMGDNPHIAETIHKRAEEENFPVDKIVILSANHKDPENYKKWCEENNKTPVNWILLDWCERAISSDYSHLEDTFEDNFNYKFKNIDKLKHYLCLMRRWKMPRVFHHMALNYFNLLEKGSVSAILAKWDIRSVFKDLDRSKIEMANEGEVTFSDCASLDDYEFNKTLKDFPRLADIVDEYQTRLKPELTDLGRSKFLYKVRSAKNVKDFLLKLPLTVDKKHFDTLDSFHHWDSEIYKNTMFSYVYETWHYSTNMVFYSEKIYKCILNFHPFLTWTNPDTMKYLRKNGYKTFEPFIDEYYDTEYIPEKRTTLLLKEMQRLCDMSINELLDWYGEQSDTLIHNYNHFMTNTHLQKSGLQFLKVYEKVVK